MPSEPSNDDRMYRRLEVGPEASAEQIGRAYRRLAHSVHPDARPEDPDAGRRFQEITEAYEILSDPVRRARYDRNRQPKVIGSFTTGSPPLTAGPVRIDPPSDPAGAPPNRVSAADLAEFVDALLQPWRWW